MIVKPKCYISYCQEDISVEKMEIFIKWLLDLCDYQIDFLFDKNVKYSESFNDFENKIYEVDAILIFFTPNYKNRCLDENDTGVSREYRKILYVLENNIKIKQQDYVKYIKGRVTIDAILFKGKKNFSVTDEFSTLHYIDISTVSKYCENKNHNLILTENFISTYKKDLHDMLNEIIVSCVEKSDEYIRDYDEILKELFINTKSEHINLPNELFIKTEAYNRIIKQQKYIIIGRKGSGKTTVKNTISNIAGKKYKGIISIIADQFSADETYQLLFLNEKVRSDIENNFSKLVYCTVDI